MSTSASSHVLKMLEEFGGAEAFRRLIAENDALIRTEDLDQGREIVTKRTSIYTSIAEHWVREQHEAFGYDRPFAMVALGGTGREEVTPYSDLDFAFLFNDDLENNLFLRHLQEQALYGAFQEQCGFSFRPYPFTMDDIPSFEEKQLNSFLDLKAIYDPSDFTETFRERIQNTFDPFEHFLHVRSSWRKQWEEAGRASERLDSFDIKNEGLRVFLSAIWILAGRKFLHSHRIYEAMPDARDLAAYELLLRIRSWIHLRKPAGEPDASGNHPQDLMKFEDFISFGEMLPEGASEAERFDFANHVRGRLLSARRRVNSFAKGVIEAELRNGRRVSPTSPIVFGSSGLYHSTSDECRTNVEKSRAALSLLLASQRYEVPVDLSELQSTFFNAGDWLVPTPELSALFYETRGSLAKTFEFLSQIDNATDRLFPGYAKFEASLDARVLSEKRSLRSVFERQKLAILEEHVAEGRRRLADAISPKRLVDIEDGVFVAIEAALLDEDHLAAVKLALRTKRLSVTPLDVRVRENEGLPLFERFSSGLSGEPVLTYYQKHFEDGDFAPECLEVAEFLITHWTAFKDFTLPALNDQENVERFRDICGTAARLRALYVFSHVDRAEWRGENEDPGRWFLTRELYAKTRWLFEPAKDADLSLRAAGYSEEHLKILRGFGSTFFGGLYRRHANRFGYHLVSLVEDPELGPKASIVRDGTSVIIGVAARDYRGLAATISGTLWRAGLALEQAHLFSEKNHSLALDFFHVGRSDTPIGSVILAAVEEAVRNQSYIDDADEAALPELRGNASYSIDSKGRCCLRYETTRDAPGLVYALSYKVYKHLNGNIFGLRAHTTRDRAYFAIYHSLEETLLPEEALEIIKGHF